MPDDEIAFRLMELYRQLRGPADDRAKMAARAEIDELLAEVATDGMLAGAAGEQ